MLQSTKKYSLLTLFSPIKKPRIFWKLATRIAKQDYERTILGPLWILLNLIIFTSCMSIVYSGLFNTDYFEYLTYMSCSMIAWVWCGNILNTSGMVYVTNSSLLMEHPIEKEYLIWTHATHQIIIFLHQMPLIIIYLSFGLIEFSINTLYLIPSIIIIFCLNIGISSTISLLVVRFRDFQKILSSLTIVIMVTTPIFWKAEMLTGVRKLAYELNPFYYMIEIIRAPLLGEMPTPKIYLISIILAISSICIGSLMHKRYGKSIIFRM